MSFGAVGIASTVGGVLTSAYGSMQGAKAQEEAAAINAANQRALAEQEMRHAEEQMRRTRENNRATLSQMRSRLAASGVLTNTGSALEAQGETAGRLEMGVQDYFEQARSQYRARQNAANMGIWEGEQASSAGMIGAAGTILGGAAQVGSTVAQGRYLGLYGGTQKQQIK